MIALSAPATLGHAAIAQRIPHQGSMCLLDRVTRWDPTHIHCEAISHQSECNPLRAFGRLGASCGIEYAAQAMAVHGALVSESATSGETDGAGPQVGFLASVRSVSLHVERLDDQTDVLAIHAERMSGDASTILYTFSVSAGHTLLLSGRAVVVLNANMPSLQQPATSHANSAIMGGTSNSV